MAEVAANLLVKVGADIADAQKKLGTMGSTISDFGKSAMKTGGMFTAGLTLPIGVAGLKAVNMASDLEESMNKVSVVFGENAAAIDTWASGAAENFGLSKQQALEAAGTFGNLFDAMGIGDQQTADMSQGLIELAADLASFNNMDPTEVLDKLRAGLVGETEPLRTLGVNLTAAATKAEAMSMGLAETEDALTPAMLAQARYNLILEDTVNAQGDFANTSDGLANSQRILKADIDDMLASLGQQLLPIFSQVVDWISQAVQWFTELDPTIQTVILAVAGLLAVAGPLITVIGVIGTVIGALASPIGIVIAAIALLAAAWATDFGGIRTIVTQFWNDHLKPIFDTLVVWLQENIPVALEKLADFWENTLQPAIKVVWDFLQDKVFPIFEDLVNIYIAAVKIELELLARLWDTVLKPAIEVVWNFLQTYLIPLFVALVDVNIAALKLAVEVLAGIWENILKPALEKVWSFLADNVIPVFVDLKAKLDGPVTTALNAITLIFDKVSGAIGAIGDAVKDVIGWLQNLASAISDISLPGWLTGKGPTGEAIGGSGSVGGSIAAGLAKDAKAIADALAALVNAFTAVAQYSGSKIGPQLNRLIDQLRGAIYKLTKLAEILKREGLDAAVVLSEAGGKIGRALTGLVDGFVAVAGYAPQVIGPQLTRLFDQLTGVVRKLERVAGLFDDDALDASVVFAEATSKILEMVKTAIDVFERLRNYTTPGIEAINRFERDMQYALERWVRWVVLTLQPLAEGVSAEMADIIAATVGAMGEALDVLAGLVAYVSPAQQAIDDFVRDLGILFTAFYNWAVGSGGSEGSPGMLMDIPPELLAVFNDVMDGLGTAVDTLTALTDYVGPTSNAIAAFIGDMGALFTAFYEWAMGTGGSEGSPGMLMEIPTELLAVFQAVMDGLGSAVDVLTGLVDYVGPSDGAITEFTSDYTQLFEEFATWAETTFADATFDATAAVASVFGDVMSGLGDAVGTLVALVDYSGPSEASITQFEADYQRLFSDFVAWAEGTLTEEGAALVGAIGDAVGAVMSGLGAAVTTLVGIVGYVGPSESAIASFEADYQRLMSDFADWATTTFTEDQAAVVQAVGEAASALFTGLGLAAGVLISIRTYVSPTASAMDNFIRDVQAVIIRFRDFASGAFTTESTEALRLFGAMIGTLFSGIGTALETLTAIGEYATSGSDFDMALQLFNQNLYRAITSWATWITTIMDPETSALVSSFAGILGDIVQGFRDALNLLMDIEAANLPTADDIAAFIAALEDLFTVVVQSFWEANDGLVNAGGAIGQTLGTIFSGINPDLWAAGLQTGAHFLGGLRQAMTDVSIITPLLNAMIDLANQLEDVLRAAWGISSPSKVAEKIGGYFVTGLQRGLEDLADIPGMMNDALGVPMFGANVSIEPAPQRAYLTVQFEGAFQAGMSPRDEARITSAMVNELRRQGVALATR